MITGQINANLEAVIPLVVQGQGEAVLALNVVIDTGYSDFLTLPAETIATLGLEQAATGVLTLADGSKVVSAIYLATVIWDGLPRHDITVDALDTAPLIGVSLLAGYELKACFVAGEPVTLTACDQPC
jgi:clan AA aspartic protease